MKRRTALAGVALGLGAALVLAATWVWPAISRPDVPAATVRRGDLVIGVEVTGTLRAVETSLVGPPQIGDVWEFKIARMAPEGDEVRQGMPVVAFDTTELDNRLERLLAEADSARTQIKKVEEEQELRRSAERLARAEADARLRKARLRVDVPDELTAAQDLEAARMDLALAEREILYLERKSAQHARADEAALAGFRSQLERADHDVRRLGDGIAQMARPAPRDGTVIYMSDWRDEKKKVGDTVWRGENVIELPALDRMQGEGQVHEADAGRVALGQPVRIRLDAHPETEFAGKVAEIGRTVQRESWRTPLKVVRLEIALDQTDTRRMRPGMRFRGEVEIERHVQALLVPGSAVVATADGPRVRRLGWAGCVEAPVRLGARGSGEVEVLEGLAEGDQVCVEGSDSPENAT